MTYSLSATSLELSSLIKEHINEEFKIVREHSVNSLDKQIKWHMNCIGFEPLALGVRDNSQGINGIYEVSNGGYFFTHANGDCLVLVGYWSLYFQHDEWMGACKHPDLQSDEEKAISKLCEAYQYAHECR